VDKKISLIWLRKDRPEFNRYELESLRRQHFDPDEYEIIVMDDSTTSATPRVFKEYSDLPIRFTHFEGWEPSDTHHVGPTGKLSTSIHLNHAIDIAQGHIVIIQFAECVHLGESLHHIWSIHKEHPNLVYIPAIYAISPEALSIHNWEQHPELLWSRPEIWGRKVNPANMDMIEDTKGALVLSMPLRYIRAMGGFTEAPLPDYPMPCDCEDEDLVRRVLRSDAVVKMGGKYIFALIEHDVHESATNTTTSIDYRARMATRIRKDAGYTGNLNSYPYYRPGTDKIPLRADDIWGTGIIPDNVRVMNLDDTIEYLPDE
jgi:hypothetical protein